MMIKRILQLFVLLVFAGSLPLQAQELAPVTVDIWSGHARITTEQAQVMFTSSPLSLKIASGGVVRAQFTANQLFSYQRDGDVVVPEEVKTLHRQYNGFLAELTEAGSETIVATLGVTMDQTGHLRVDLTPTPEGADEILVNLEQSKNEHYYGLGDLWHTPSVDVKGAAVELMDHSGTPDECNWVPFFMSTKGYGIFIDSAYPATIDFGKSDPARTILEFQAPTLSMHLWAGETMRDVLPQYLDYTGYPPMPPDWVFLPQKWRDAGTWDDVWEDVEMMQKNDMPLGAVWLDRPWMLGGYSSDDYLFDEKRYPNPEENIHKLHSMGIRLLVWGCDFLTSDSKYYQEGVKNNYFVGGFGPQNRQTDTDRHIVDLANPEAREWFKNIIKNALRMGVDGIKLDRGQNYPLNVTPPSGRDPRAMHNYHAYLMVKTFAEALQEVRGKDYQLTPRAGWAGTQAWTEKWPGDMDSDFSHDQGLPAVIRAQSAAGLTGFAYWGSDIGGYGSRTPKTVFVRWLEHGVFSPIMQTPGKGDHNNSPFSWDDETTRIYKFYAQLRQKMIPYIVRQAEIAHTTGTPMVRHLAWSWPDDPEVHSKDYEYMFGEDLLVACIISESNTREVYLPAGTWVDFWNRDRTIQGPTTLTVTMPLSKIPLYIRKNATFDFELPDVQLPE